MSTLRLLCRHILEPPKNACPPLNNQRERTQLRAKTALPQQENLAPFKGDRSTEQLDSRHVAASLTTQFLQGQTHFAAIQSNITGTAQPGALLRGGCVSSASPLTERPEEGFPCANPDHVRQKAPQMRLTTRREVRPLALKHPLASFWANGDMGVCMRRFVLTVSVLFALGGAPVAAQTSAPQAQPLGEVFTCADISDGAERLQCYDAAVGRLRSAESQGRIVAVDREQVAALERESFGFNLPSMTSLFSRRATANAGDQLDRIEMQVERIVALPNGRHRFIMSNGQRWVQIEARSASNVDPGDQIAIRRSALGSYMLSPEHGAAHRVRREE